MSDSNKYIDMKEAARLTNRSYSTMRNLVRNMTTEEKKRYLQRDGKKILLLKSFIASKYRIIDNNTDSQSEFEKRTLEILEKQLKAKDEQIETSQKIITEMVERLKEANYNQGSLHKFLNRIGLEDSDIKKLLK